VINEDCDTTAESGYSEALEVPTSLWGDLVGDCTEGACSPSDRDTDFDDIAAVVDKFRDLPGAPIKARTDVAPDRPDWKIDFTDIPAVVDAFRVLPYPYGGPVGCP
jgi:hypothetical protein